MEKIIRLRLVVTVCLLTTAQLPLLAQDTTKSGKERKNTIHFNITHPLIFGSGSIIFGYERILKNQRSFTVNIGQANFPTLDLVTADSIRANGLRGQGGFHISGDYRFYLAKLNKHPAPRGVYIGPYFSYNYFKNDHRWELKNTAGGTTPVESETIMKVSTLGLEMGYQFVFWNRLSVDMILAGPGLAGYSLKTNLGTNLSETDKEKFFEKLNEALTEKFPGYSMAFNEDEFKKKGTTSTTNFGFRYMVQVGYRF